EEYYVLSADRLFVMQEFLDALRVVLDRGYEAVVVTNQKSVHRGLITMEGIDEIHAHLRRVIDAAGLRLRDIYVAPHGDGHPDRKPNPGMLLRAASDHDLDLGRSWMIGDSERDIQAGLAAGCTTQVLVKDAHDETDADYRLLHMRELPGFLEEHLPHLEEPV
ncbi:MAG: HAD-IIIA family hydrolase, partial [Akkermansiaceae bacterium]|nr:HAD-IIIA family hydrolase [Akkermansiaceae bacterium]